MSAGNTLNTNTQRIIFCFVLMFQNTFLGLPFSVEAQTTVPPEAQSGIVDQGLRQSRPTFKPPPEQEPPEQEPPEQEPPEIIIKDSRKLKDPGAGPSFFVNRIEIEGNTLIDDETLSPIVELGEDGMEITLGVLALMANEITALYASKGYLLTRAFIPQQELKDGVVKLQVSEGRIGKVEVKGTKKLNKEDFQDRMAKVKEEAVLREQTLERTLLELNDLMGVQVRSTLRPGELPGTSDLVLEVTESRPYTMSFDGDNMGSRFTGPIRFGLSGTFGNLFTLGDQFYFRWTRSNFGQDMYSPSYTFPINNQGTRLKLAYTFSEFELGEGLSSLSAGGTTKTVALELSQPLIRTRSSQLTVRGGFDISSYANAQLGQNNTKDDPINISLGFGGNISDPYLGRNFYDLKFAYNLKEVDPNYGKLSRTNGNGQVFTTTFSLNRFQSAKIFNSYFMLKGTGQLNSARVISPGQTSIGGMGTVRGFPLSEFAGDEGYVLSIEYVIPAPWKISLYKGIPTLDKILSFNAFLDHGKVFIQDRIAGENDQAITGVGGGFKINIPKKENVHPAASFALAYGIPTMGSPDPSDTTFGTIYVSGLMNY